MYLARVRLYWETGSKRRLVGDDGYYPNDVYIIGTCSFRNSRIKFDSLVACEKQRESNHLIDPSLPIIGEDGSVFVIGEYSLK